MVVVTNQMSRETGGNYRQQTATTNSYLDARGNQPYVPNARYHNQQPNYFEPLPISPSPQPPAQSYMQQPQQQWGGQNAQLFGEYPNLNAAPRNMAAENHPASPRFQNADQMAGLLAQYSPYPNVNPTGAAWQFQPTLDIQNQYLQQQLYQQQLYQMQQQLEYQQQQLLLAAQLNAMGLYGYATPAGDNVAALMALQQQLEAQKQQQEQDQLLLLLHQLQQQQIPSQSPAELGNKLFSPNLSPQSATQLSQGLSGDSASASSNPSAASGESIVSATGAGTSTGPAKVKFVRMDSKLFSTNDSSSTSDDGRKAHLLDSRLFASAGTPSTNEDPVRKFVRLDSTLFSSDTSGETYFGSAVPAPSSKGILKVSASTSDSDSAPTPSAENFSFDPKNRVKMLASRGKGPVKKVTMEVGDAQETLTNFYGTVLNSRPDQKKKILKSDEVPTGPPSIHATNAFSPAWPTTRADELQKAEETKVVRRFHVLEELEREQEDGFQASMTEQQRRKEQEKLEKKMRRERRIAEGELSKKERAEKDKDKMSTLEKKAMKAVRLTKAQEIKQAVIALDIGDKKKK